jgi:hypothetical protein
MDPAVLSSFGLTVAGIVVAAIGGFWSGSIFGALLALGGLGAGCYGMWKGMQKESSGTSAMAILAIGASLIVAGLLLVLKIVHALGS